MTQYFTDAIGPPPCGPISFVIPFPTVSEKPKGTLGAPLTPRGSDRPFQPITFLL